MKKIIFCLFILLTAVSVSYSQGTIRGKISDKNGETLIGVIVVLKDNPSHGASTDLDGNFTLKIEDALPHTLAISYVSYKSIEEPFQLENGAVLIKNFVMESAARDLGVVEIVAKSTKEKEYFMENLKKNASASIDYISGETMKKTGDANVAAAVARVPGVSTSGNGFITVRGIGDRYVKTTINGLSIPTLDPFTNNIKLDIFPSSLVDNIIITKTASPDLPGDWAGAYISVETKDYPEQLAVNINTSFGYNSQSTFKNILASQESKTDWLGYDSNFREYDHNGFTQEVAPSKYQELSALGLADFYKSQGITEETPWNDNYYKLGLVELGLLNKADFNDENAFKEAKLKYNEGPYAQQAYKTINEDAAKSGMAFKNNWNTFKKQAPINFSQSFSIGNQVDLFGKPLGIIAGFRYSKSIRYDENSIAIRTDRTAYDSLGEPFFTDKTHQQIAQYTNGWSSIINVAYKYSPHNSISYMFMPNFLGVNNLRNGMDTITIGQTTSFEKEHSISQFYEERKQLIHQLKSEHYLPGSKLKIELNGSYTKGESSVPDFKNLRYFTDDQNEYQLDLTLSDIRRNYRYLNENMLNLSLFTELPINEKPGLVRKLKLGGSYLSANRDFNQYDYRLNLIGTPLTIENNDIDAYFDPNNFGFDPATGKINYYYQKFIDPANKTIGESDVSAAYVSADYSIYQRVRVAGGVRVEHTKIFSDAFLFNNLGYEKDDPRRLSHEFIVNPTNLEQVNYLPSINFIYKVRKDDQKPVNLRLNYSQTLARPSLREYSKTLVYDFELNSFVIGNDSLKIVNIHNYDVRLESYFKSGDNISLSLFYKDLKNHIELIQNPTYPGYTWINVDKSNVVGIELEGKKNIGNNFEFRSNITLVKSETNFTAGTYTVKRVMFGQAPYVVNGMFSYKNDSINLTATISYNIQGPKLVFAGTNLAAPDIYELPRHVLNFKVSKSLGKHFSISVTIRDLLNTTRRRAYKMDNEFKLDYDTYRYGTNYMLSVNYKL